MPLKSKTLCTSALEEFIMENSAPIPADPLALGATTIGVLPRVGHLRPCASRGRASCGLRGRFTRMGDSIRSRTQVSQGFLKKAAYSQGFRSLTEFLDCAARKSGKELSQTYLNCATQSFPANVKWRLIYPDHWKHDWINTHANATLQRSPCFCYFYGFLVRPVQWNKKEVQRRSLSRFV